MTHEERAREYINSVGGVWKDRSYEKPLTKEEEEEILRDARRRDREEARARSDAYNAKYREEQRRYMANLSPEEREQLEAEQRERAWIESMPLEGRRRYYERMNEEQARQREHQEAASRKEDREAYSEDYPHLKNWLVDPQTLGERRARANYWRLGNMLQQAMDRISGKTHRFEKLWRQFTDSEDEIEKETIIIEMERMYPTSTAKLRRAEKAEARAMGR